MEKKKNRKKNYIWKIILAGIIVGMVIFCMVYVNDYYHADMDAINAYVTEKPVEK